MLRTPVGFVGPGKINEKPLECPAGGKDLFNPIVLWCRAYIFPLKLNATSSVDW